jgi:hypothetical protein
MLLADGHGMEGSFTTRCLLKRVIQLFAASGNALVESWRYKAQRSLTRLFSSHPEIDQ